MRSLSMAAAVLLSSISIAATAGTVAVADSQSAVMSTDYAKKTFDKLNADMKPQRDRLDQLRKEISGMEEKFQKNGSIMSDKEKQDLQKQAESKLNEFNGLAQSVQKRAQEVQQDMVQKMLPKMEIAVEEIRKAGNIDVIVEKKNVIWAEPAIDITKKITEKLNAAMVNAPVTTTPAAAPATAPSK